MNILKNLKNYGHKNIVTLLGSSVVIMNPYRIKIECISYVLNEQYDRTKHVDEVIVNMYTGETFNIDGIKSLNIIRKRNEPIIAEVSLHKPLSLESLNELTEKYNLMLCNQYSFEQEYRNIYI